MVRYVIAAVAVLLLLPAGAHAQGEEAPASDPDAGSPSGTIYELPLERGRKDAAPRTNPRRKAGNTPRGGGSPSVGGPGAQSPIRSENNFGSSSQVPGVDDDLADAGAGGDGNGRAGGNSGGRGPAGESDGPGTTAPGTATLGIDPAADSADGPSWGLIVPLIALLLILGITAGMLAARARRA